MSHESLKKTYILRDENVMRLMWAFLKANAKDMADKGQPLEARITVYKKSATDPQRSLIWIINEQIAQGAWVRGRRFDAETWHEYAKRELLPEETRRGVQKWLALPDGQRELTMSTENLDREEKSTYIDKLLAFAAEQGVDVHIEESDRSAAYNYGR